MGSALGPQSWMIPKRSTHRKFARPRSKRPRDSVASPTKRRKPRLLSNKARLARPSRASHGVGADGVPVFFSGTAVARPMSRLTPAGSPSRSTATVLLSQNWITLSTKATRPVSQAVTPPASSAIRRAPGLLARAPSMSASPGSRSSSRHVPARCTSRTSGAG